MFFLWYIFIGLVSGYLGSLISQGKGQGFLLNIVVGIVGGVVGGWLLSLFGLFPVGTIGSLITSVLGAVVFLWFVSLFRTKHKE